MGIEDREWRREQVRQQRAAKKHRTHQQHTSNMSVDQFLARQRKQPSFKAKPTTNKNMSKTFAVLFLLIFMLSAAFLLYQWLV